MSPNHPIETNRSLWNGWTALHRDTEFYGVDAFLAGQSTLKRPELEVVGAVAAKSLLHLQCHFGLDTLSWARLGARATGVDFSDAAIDLARSLAAEAGLDAEFVCCDVYDLPSTLDRTFDIVFTSYGVLWWLPDLDRWARIVARFLKPDGAFHLVEFHPVLNVLDDDGVTIRSPYLAAAPERYTVRGSYAAPDADFTHDAIGWPHGLAEVVTALVSAGLRIESLREYEYSSYGCFPYLEEARTDEWVLRGRPDTLPLMFSIRARRE